ncbi:MAG: M43 family zinc metalloprotease [Chitinophagaceae bacterium]
MMNGYDVIVKLLVIFLFMCDISVNAQHKILSPLTNSEGMYDPFTLKNCVSDILLNEQRKNPPFKAREDEINARILRVTQTLDDTIYTLPVVFHIIMQNPNSITDQNVIDKVKNLNDIFGKTGVYSSSMGADTKIKFCLARKDPDGGNTTGITRTSSFFGSDLESLIEDDKLKNLVQWDPSRYINIWLISNITTEIMAIFNCGTWTRLGEAGYAFLPVPSSKLDGIVLAANGGSTLLAHEMGHYLGLYHTFEGLRCTNNNCETDGDRVCDTPPDASTGSSSSCSNPTNSCSTDTLSNYSNGSFLSDVPDQITNIMDYGNDACHNQFTEGQAKRMKAVIITQRSQLLQNECDKPCPENSIANFTRNNWDPVPGNSVKFTSTGSGASNFSWYIDDVLINTTASFTHTFASVGKYKVTLKSYNNDPACYAAYSDDIIVTCGTHARFFTDKRIIASKMPIFTDSIRFTNNSVNATRYQWLMNYNMGPEQTVSTSKDYKHVFVNPGDYTFRLIATNGSCSDTTEFFPVPVADPTPDAVLAINTGQCYQQSKISLMIRICNNGYAPIAAKTPVTFYDTDPRKGGAHKLGTTFFFPVAITGHCCSSTYPFIIDSVPGLNQIFAVVNDDGSTIPLNLPNTSLPETDYTNNIGFIDNLQIHVTVTPATATLVPGDTLQLSAQIINGFVSPSFLWSSSKDLTCTTCPDPNFIADKKVYTVTKQLVVTNTFGCRDTSYAVIKIPPYDDFTVTIDSIKCAGTDSLYGWFTFCNSFKRGIIPQGLQLTLYDEDPASANAHLLAPVYSLNQLYNGKCFSFAHPFKRTHATKIYAVVNNLGTAVPISFPRDSSFTETDYSNNTTTFNYRPETVLLQPMDTTVFRKQSIPANIISTVYDPSSISWLPASGYSLNCTTCASPVVTLKDSSILQMQMFNQYGCLIEGKAALHVFPPDLTIKILETSCYTNATTLVKFKICMNNDYDSVNAGIPVSFYDGNPEIGSASLLGSVFYTGAKHPANCDTVYHIIPSPTTSNLFAVVNDKGNSPQVSPNQLVNETNYTNNTSDTSTAAFKARVTPADTTVLRFNHVQITGSVTGGILSSFNWKPASFLSCYNCISPIVTPAYSNKYSFIAQNENYCVDTAYANIKTLAGGVISIPNAFTPNNDGKNDVLYVMGNKDVSVVKEFAIFNRWGQKIFAASNTPANDPLFGWNGILNGQPAAAETYVYFATILFTDGSSKVFKGTVILVR